MARNWQSLKSKNRVFCNGRCITGHNIGIFIFAVLLISVISGLFFGFDCPYLTKRLSPAIPIFAALLFFMVICCILRTAFTDPGILPRATPEEIRYLEKSDNLQNVSLTGRVIEVQMRGGHVMQLKFCQTCKIFRPPRVSHCSLCDACIANFDHHCPWVGNCVGLRNYRYFYLFLFSLSLLCIYIFVFNIINIALRAQDASTVADAIRDTPATIVEALVCFISIWSVIGLWGYHTYLICRSVTTNEDIKDTWRSTRRGETLSNPFSRGHSLLNCFSALCGPLPPSFLNLRAIVKQENNIPMTAIGMNNSQHDTIRYHPDDSAIYNNRVWDSSAENQPSSFQMKQQQRPYTLRDYV
ncbi:unnamed protein product [Rotaria socialis]|uniref:Palmitoyltransferase n=2 Tax=Rotaria socialis TaxID=392032 RepID=A0A820K7D1_9BILA|nr:unnamed protein product [Rotaria socialis]CAF3268602.1 unnamed protein product [Rotaria socialis]CAF3367914.1 unnamed protein product [Rotaria socialis]CAF3389389.1 unnamed protein product [Rotaria socialis]CAF3390172.1 unnamed protein product [Rotaria socialis]